ncbi:MAG: hypothetical protein LKF61_03215 [Eggerthellaceae bacterium]|jgi:hypothetical protein|nr:hypothetical protein [Eggerthellaceae bacterium]
MSLCTPQQFHYVVDRARQETEIELYFETHENPSMLIPSGKGLYFQASLHTESNFYPNFDELWNKVRIDGKSLGELWDSLEVINFDDTFQCIFEYCEFYKIPLPDKLKKCDSKSCYFNINYLSLKKDLQNSKEFFDERENANKVSMIYIGRPCSNFKHGSKYEVADVVKNSAGIFLQVIDNVGKKSLYQTDNFRYWERAVKIFQSRLP